ncbi:MAG TPA: 50S ribosomal protein L29 [bacterium]|nr:50S ribosomal protein L29 [bacterium]
MRKQVKGFRDMTLEELKSRVDSLRKNLFGLRFQLSTGQLEQTNQINALKKDIARALTVMREMEKAGEGARKA